MKGVRYSILFLVLFMVAIVSARSDTNVLLTLGTTYRGEIAEPGEVDHFVFSASSGQRFYYDALDNDLDTITTTLFTPSGGTVFSANTDYNQGPFTLTEPGEYTLVFTASADTVGDYIFRALDPMAGPVVDAGTVANGQLSPRLETDIFRFTGGAGQRASLSPISHSSLDADWRLVGPANQALANGRIDWSLDEVQLPADGTYSLLVEGDDPNPTPMLYAFTRSEASDAPVEVNGLGS